MLCKLVPKLHWPLIGPVNTVGFAVFLSDEINGNSAKQQ